MEVILKNVAAALLAYSAHYSATKFYNYACVPDGFMGYLSGLITTGSPVCQAGVQIISNTQVSYSSMIMIGITRVLVDMVAPGTLNDMMPDIPNIPKVL
uniref:Uncharacterized protein n=1 Tax=viral metagenome TaxID=1070528 RepID=A0A6C0ANQ7_9ZZZZ